MNCQCQGVEELFDEPLVSKELSEYRKKGPAKTTRMLTEAIAAANVEGMTLLDIGGGIGAIQHELMRSGVTQAVDVDASKAYLSAAQAEAIQQGIADRVAYYHGDFVDLSGDIAPADIVTLDRVICCYDDMERLVGLSVARAQKLYGVVLPRDTLWTKAWVGLSNLFYRLKRSAYRGYVHPTRAVEAVIQSKGFRRKTYRQTLLWQVIVYTR